MKRPSPPFKPPPFGAYRLAIPAAVILLGLLLVVTLKYDSEIFIALNGLHSSVTDWFWLALTNLSDGLVMGIMLAAFLVVNPRVTALGLCLVILSTIAVHIFKATIDAPRPAAVLESVHVVGNLLRSGSFPSGHAAVAMSAGLAVAHYSRSELLGGAAIGAAILIGVSRVFVGAHFPSDVVGAILIAVGFYALLMLTVWRRVERFVPSGPAFANRRFRAVYHLAGIAALFTLVGYAPFFSEFPALSGSVAVAVLVVLLRAPRHPMDHDGTD